MIRVLLLPLLLIFAGCNCNCLTNPIKDTSKDTSKDIVTSSFDLIASGPANASPGDIIIYDASESKADSITWSAFIVTENAAEVKLIPFENNTKCIVPPKVGQIYLTVAGCKDGVVKVKTYRTLVSSDCNKPDPGPSPVIYESELTKFVRTELSKVNSPDKNSEKNILKNNINTVLDQQFSDPVDFTSKLRELNQSTISSSMKTNWANFNKAIGDKLNSMNLTTMSDHIKAYTDFRKGLE